MLKDRLTKWGLKKNITKQHIATMIRKRNDRQRIGKATVFYVYGKEVSLQKLGPYWRRYIRSVEGQGLPLQTQDLPTTPRDLTCLTPPPIPIAAPDEMNYHHQLLRSIQDYCFGNFDAGLWAISSDQVWKSSLVSGKPYAKLNSVFICARQLARSGQYLHAQKKLDVAFTILKELVLCRDPYLLKILIFNMKQTEWQIDHNLRKAISNFNRLAANEALAVLGAHSPLNLILEYFSNGGTKFDGLYQRLWKCLVESFINKTGYGCKSTVAMICDYNQEVLLESDGLTALAAQERLLDTCKSIYGTGSLTAFNTCTTLAYFSIRLQKTHEAETQMLQAITNIHLSQDPLILGHYASELVGLAQLQNLNGKPDMAEASFREACRNCWVLCGKTSAHTLFALTALKQFLTETQKIDSIEEVEAQIIEVLEARGEPRYWRPVNISMSGAARPHTCQLMDADQPTCPDLRYSANFLSTFRGTVDPGTRVDVVQHHLQMLSTVWPIYL